MLYYMTSLSSKSCNALVLQVLVLNLERIFNTVVPLSCQRQKKNPHIKQNITVPVPVSSTEGGGSEWLLAEEISGTIGVGAVYSSRKANPSTA